MKRLSHVLRLALMLSSGVIASQAWANSPAQPQFSEHDRGCQIDAPLAATASATFTGIPIGWSCKLMATWAIKIEKKGPLKFSILDHSLMWTRLSADDQWALPLVPMRDDFVIHGSMTGADAPQYFSFTGKNEF